MSGNLTPKQKMFCQEYLIDLNATQAAIRAGYSEKTANRIASENLSKPVIQEYIQELMDERSKRVQINADNVLQEIGLIGFANAKDYFEWTETGVRLKPSEELTREQASVIAELQENVSESGRSLKIKLYDKLSALEKLGKHLKLFTDKVQVDGGINIVKLDDDDLNL